MNNPPYGTLTYLRSSIEAKCLDNCVFRQIAAFVDVPVAVSLGAFTARPLLVPDSYWVGVGSHYLCSSSSPPGGGIHGMCGHLAARAALQRHATRTR
jgi:hypothetical protein